METKRVASPGAEKWLGVVQKVLNDGEIELVDYMGTEEQLVGIARISHGKILPHTDEKDAQRLIDYFMKNKHTSPFEFVDLTWRWRLPIFVARQVVRHRTASINEKSARYSKLDANMYIPELSRIQGQDTKNKQGSAGELSLEVREVFRSELQQVEHVAQSFYSAALSPSMGIAKELARIHLPVGVYTDWVWKMDLHNLFHFLGLRLDEHAQYEVRVYAEAMYKVIKDAYPLCCKAFEEYQLFAKTFSYSEAQCLRTLVLEAMSHRGEEKGTQQVRMKINWEGKEMKAAIDKLILPSTSTVMSTSGAAGEIPSSNNKT